MNNLHDRIVQLVGKLQRETAKCRELEDVLTREAHMGGFSGNVSEYVAKTQGENAAFLASAHEHTLTVLEGYERLIAEVSDICIESMTHAHHIDEMESGGYPAGYVGATHDIVAKLTTFIAKHGGE